VKQSLEDLDTAQRNFDKIAAREDRSAGILDKARNRVMDARNALEQRDFLEAQEMARSAQQDTRELSQYMRALQQMEQITGKRDQHADAAARAAREAEDRVTEVKKRLDKLFPDPKDVLSQKELAQLDDLRKRQQEISQRTQRLSEQMKGINKQAPIFDPSAQAQVEGAKGAMDRAGQELGQQQAGRAQSSQATAMSQLQKMKEAMKRQQGSGGQQGMPLPMGGMPSPFGEGFDPRNQEKVEIPTGDTFKVPPEFRRDILDAMKQGTPEKFKQQVNEFYKELIK
jgi:chromosome segregation ATPase